MGTGEAWCCAVGLESPEWALWVEKRTVGGNWQNGGRTVGPGRTCLGLFLSLARPGRDRPSTLSVWPTAGSPPQEEAALRVPTLGGLAVWAQLVTVHQPEPSPPPCARAATRATASADCPDRPCLSNSL